MAQGHGKATHRNWNPEEDELLHGAVAAHDGKNWKSIAEDVPGRSSQQCYKRWNYTLKPGLRHGAWTAEEKRTFIDVHRRLGNKWVKIAKELPGRTGIAVRDHWRITLQKKVGVTMDMSDEPVTRIYPSEANAVGVREEAVVVASERKTQTTLASEPDGHAAATVSQGGSRAKRPLDVSIVHNSDNSRGRGYRSKRHIVGRQAPVASAAPDGSSSRPPVSSSNPLYLDELLQILREEGLI